MAVVDAVALVESAKKTAAYHAVEDHLLSAHSHVGIGSGSTVVYVVEAIAARGPGFYGRMTFYPTGSQSRGLIRAAGLNMCALDERPVVGTADGTAAVPVELDVAFDGADEVDEDLNCIKGGGACLFQEKLVAAAAKKFVVVADYRKMSPRLCTRWTTVPIEVLPLATPDVLARLRALGSASPAVRSGLPAKAGECVTDNAMWIVDAPFPPLMVARDFASLDSRQQPGQWEVDKLAEALIRIPGVVETGLFCETTKQKPVAAYFGMEDGSVEVKQSLAR